MAALRFTTAGESHGPGLVAIVEGLPAGLELDRERIDREMARRQLGHGRGGRMKIETRRGRGPLRRPPRAHARQPDRGAGRQPRLRQLGGADEPVAGRRRGRGVAPAAPRPRRPRRRCRSTATATSATCSSAPPRARPRPGSPPGRWRRSSCAALGVSVHSHVLRIASVAAPERDDLGARATSPPSTTRRCAASTRTAEAAMVAEIDRLRKENESLGGDLRGPRLRPRSRARLARRLGRAPRRAPRPGGRLDPGGQGRLGRRGLGGRGPAGLGVPRRDLLVARSAAITARPTAPAASRAACRTASRSSCAAR